MENQAYSVPRVCFTGVVIETKELIDLNDPLGHGEKIKDHEFSK